MRKLRFLALSLAVVFLLPLAAHALSYETVIFDSGNAAYLPASMADGDRHNVTTTSDFDVLVNDGEESKWVTAFCVEPNQGAVSGRISLAVDVVSLTDVNGGVESAWMMEYSDKLTGYTEKEMNAGLQLAIWEVVTEDNGVYNLNSGDFSIDTSYAQYVPGLPTIFGLANDLLAALPSNFTSEDILYLSSNYAIGQNAQYQDFILKGVSTVPEPATMALLGLGLLGLAGLRRKFNK